MRRHRFQFWFATATIISVSASTCFSTTVVAIRTPDVFVIAADSAGTFRGGGNPQTTRQVSKIFQKGGVLYAIGGLVKDPNRQFDPAGVIAKCLETSEPLKSAVKNVEPIISRSLGKLLSKLKSEEPMLFRDAIAGENRGTTILLASFENGEPIAIGVRFTGEVDSQGNVTVRKTRLACPGEDCPDGNYTFFIGYRKAIDKYVTDHSRHFRMSPEETARFMVQLEIDAKTPGVEPPIDVVRLNKDGVQWLSRKDN